MTQPSFDLNQEQLKAVNHIEGPMLVLAGAGSGKTRIVTQRILHLLQIGVPASEILAVTFTNKAAEEMKQRILRASKTYVLTATFHSLCARILRESISFLGYANDFLIVDEEDSEKTLKQCLATLGIKEDKNLLKSIKKGISQAKSELLAPDELNEELKGLQDVYALYQSKLKSYNALDFDDLLFLTVKLFKDFPDVLSSYQKRWSFILIDEYQDTNHAQYLLVKLLSDQKHNLFAVGDPDQSIYSWRGANIHNILNFERDYPGTQIIRLEQNYRSCNNILKAANALIQNNESRYEKNLWSAKEDGDKITLHIAESERDEASFVIQKAREFHLKKNLSYNDCAIFYRTNFQSRTFEDALLREKIPYVIVGGLSFYQRREIKDILAFLRLILSDFDFIAFARTINLPKRGIGAAAQDKLRELAQEKNLGIFCLCEQITEKKIDVKLSAKQMQGLENYVTLIQTLRVMHKLKKPVSEILQEAVSRSNYLEFLREDQETFDERKQNLEELSAKAFEWEQEATNPTLSSFLEEIALKPSSEETTEQEEAIKLMTLHNGKGLEFPLVFLVGLEEDLFPHINSKDSPSLIEEERRLCYVGMTRAQDFLFLTASRYRFLWGSPKTMRPSRFLKEIPTQFLKGYSRTEESSIDSFACGDTVSHKDFGIGIIHKAYQTSLGQTYDVFFPEKKVTRSLAAKYAKLVPA